MIPCMLIAYDSQGNVIATLGHSVVHDDDGDVVGMVDFGAHEQAGGEMTDVWIVEQEVRGTERPGPDWSLCPGGPDVGHRADKSSGECPGGEYRRFAKGSKTWPEWIAGRVYDFRVELHGPPGQKRISALVHRASGARRERAVIEAAIASRIAEANGAPADIRDLVGGPERPLVLDDRGQTASRRPVTRPQLPMIGLGSRSEPTRLADPRAADSRPSGRNQR